MGRIAKYGLKGGIEAAPSTRPLSLTLKRRGRRSIDAHLRLADLGCPVATVPCQLGS